MSDFSPSARNVPAASPGILGGTALALGGSVLLAIAAHIAVPFWPVPLTLQTLAILLIGAAAGPRLGAAVVVAYILEGLAGLPVFAAGTGPAALIGPTGGYLVGYLPAVALAGFAGRRGWLASPIRAALAFCAADALVFVVGLARLAGLFGVEKALAVGLAPFLLGEGLKIGLAAAVVAAGRSVVFKR